MTPFELTYLIAEPCTLPLYRKVRRLLLELTRSFPQDLDILDVGGRKSHYSIGVPGRITIMDLPRQTDVQRKLNLGIDQKTIEQTYARRSNLDKILFDDMTHSSLPDSSFDCVVAVEVLEHVERDIRFVEEVRRILKPGGIFLMTTPNGDFVKNTNPDHKRHYSRDGLRSVLRSCFENVEVRYAIPGGTCYSLGLRAWSAKRPMRTLFSMLGNICCAIRSISESASEQEKGTYHLIATAKKQISKVTLPESSSLAQHNITTS